MRRNKPKVEKGKQEKREKYKKLDWRVKNQSKVDQLKGEVGLSELVPGAKKVRTRKIKAVKKR